MFSIFSLIDKNFITFYQKSSDYIRINIYGEENKLLSLLLRLIQYFIFKCFHLIYNFILYCNSKEIFSPSFFFFFLFKFCTILYSFQNLIFISIMIVSFSNNGSIFWILYNCVFLIIFTRIISVINTRIDEHYYLRKIF